MLVRLREKNSRHHAPRRAENMKGHVSYYATVQHVRVLMRLTCRIETDESNLECRKHRLDVEAGEDYITVFARREYSCE